MLKVSICIPIYNVSKYIERCARSVFAQTYQSWEVIFVDDCSPDDSVEVLEHVLLKYPDIKDKVRIILHEHNRGLAASRNTGVDAAKGEFIMHVDSDDWLEPNAIELLVNRQEETNADIVSGKAIAHYADHKEIMKEPEYKDKDEMMQHMVELTIDHVIWRRLIRKSLYEKNDIRCVEGVNIGEDHYTLPRLIYYAKKCVSLDKVVYHYNCMNEGSYMRDSSMNARTKRYESDCKSIDILLDFFADKDDRCIEILNISKANYLYNHSTICINLRDKQNYKKLISELYSIDNRYLTTVGLTNHLTRFINKTYFRRKLYTFIRIDVIAKTRVKLLSLILKHK